MKEIYEVTGTCTCDGNHNPDPSVKCTCCLFCDNINISLASGEEFGTMYEFHDMLENGKVDIVQPDMSRCGGITMAKKIADMAYLKGKKLIAGNILDFFKEELSKEEIPYIDLLKREEFAVLNAIATAEGTVQIAMEESQRTVHGSKVLIMGFGRIGKILAKMLDGVGAKVFCEARKDEDIAFESQRADCL